MTFNLKHYVKGKMRACQNMLLMEEGKRKDFVECKTFYTNAVFVGCF